MATIYFVGKVVGGNVVGRLVGIMAGGIMIGWLMCGFGCWAHRMGGGNKVVLVQQKKGGRGEGTRAGPCRRRRAKIGP